MISLQFSTRSNQDFFPRLKLFVLVQLKSWKTDIDVLDEGLIVVDHQTGFIEWGTHKKYGAMLARLRKQPTGA